MKKLLTFLLLIASTSPMMFAQKHTFENVGKMNIRNRGYIMENNTLAGYYVLYLKDKVDKKNAAFSLELLDNDLNVAKSISIIRPKNSILLENVFNGNTFMLMFYDGKILELLTYDKKGNKLGSKQYPKLTMMEKVMLQAALEKDEQNATIFPIGNEGFIKVHALKNKKLGYEIEAFDNNLKSIWKYGSDAKSDMVEGAFVISSKSDYLAINVVKKTSATTMKMDFYLNVLESKTGKLVFDKALKENNSELSLLNCSVNPDQNEIIISGEYFPPGEDVGKSKSQGLYLMTLDLSGTQKYFKKLSWAKDLAKINSNDNDKGSTNYSLFFHKMNRMADGKIYAIGEQYKKAVSAMGMASMVLSAGRGGVSAASIFVLNMVVLEFDSTFNLLNAYEVPKKKTEVSLPSGSAYYSTSVLGNFVKSMGGYDYEFTSVNSGNNEFYSLYKDYNRKEESGQKADLMVGVLSLRDGKFTSERLPMNTEGNEIWISPAKPGYIAVSEYFRKKKTIYYHLEKIAY